MSEPCTAQPLRRMGVYVVDELPWTNPLPERGVAPEGLSAHWLELVGAVVGKVQRRQAVTEAMDAASARGDVAAAMGANAWRYSAKIEIKTAESVLALLHRILAPGASFLCDAQCPHVTLGATPEQAKRFLDSLDAATADRRARWRDTKWDHPCYEDLQDELGVYEKCRGQFAKLLVPA